MQKDLKKEDIKGVIYKIISPSGYLKKINERGKPEKIVLKSVVISIYY